MELQMGRKEKKATFKTGSWNGARQTVDDDQEEVKGNGNKVKEVGKSLCDGNTRKRGKNEV